MRTMYIVLILALVVVLILAACAPEISGVVKPREKFPDEPKEGIGAAVDFAKPLTKFVGEVKRAPPVS